MQQKCDHTATGAVICNAQGELLMFKRGTPPWGVAGPAGHCDGDSYEDGLKREVFEEVGLRVISTKFLTTFTIYKGCRRPDDGHPYHVWQFFQAEVTGNIRPCERETNGVRWYKSSEIRQLMYRTKLYHQDHTISEQDYEAEPGLDLSWYYLFKELPELLK